jgi:hypothetical protein
MVERAPGEHRMVASRPSAFPQEAVYTLGLGIAGLFGYLAWAGDPRRRRKRETELAMADRRR